MSLPFRISIVISIFAVGLSGCSGASAPSGHIESRSCAQLAADPIEVIDGQHGVRLDRIVGRIAIAACEREVERNPTNAAAWRHLARSYAAGVRYQSMEEETYLPLYLDALQNAAERGDRLAQIELASFNYRARVNRDETMVAQRALLQAMPAGGNRLDVFARTKLEAMLHAAEVARITSLGNFSAINAAWDEYFRNDPEDRLNAEFSRLGAEIGWQAMHDHYWEMRDRGQCRSFQRMCESFHNAITRSEDVPTYLAISVDSLASAYRNADLAFEKVRNEGYDREVALNVGRGWAEQAKDFAERAQRLGTPEERAAAEDLLIARRQFIEYNNNLSRMAREEAREASERAWTALAVLVVAAVVLSASSGSTPGDTADVSQHWLEAQRSGDCNAADIIMSNEGSLGGAERTYWGAVRAGC